MNPELERNLWLETQPRQLIGAGVVLALIFAAVWLIDRGHSPYAFIVSGGAVFVVCALVWGPRAARASVVNEVYARTWDFQRLSALSPWTLAWGKLVGSTSRANLFAAGGLAVALLQFLSITSFARAGYWLVVAVGLAVLMQASGLAVGLIEVRKARAVGRRPGLRSPGLLLLALAVLAAVAAVWAAQHIHTNRPFDLAAAYPVTVAWWGRPHDAVRFAAESLVVFAAFAVLWAWRLMRLELQMANAPWAWPLFVVVAGLYVAGFEPQQTYTAAVAAAGRLRQAATVSALLAYAAVFVEPADRVRTRLFASDLARFRLRSAILRLPLVVTPAKLCVLAALVAAAVYAHEGEGAVAVLTLANAAFVVRDLGAVTAMRFTPRGQGGDLGVLFGLAMLYVVGAIVTRAVGGEAGLALAIPNSRLPGLSLAAGVIEAALAWGFAAWRIAQPAERQSAVFRTPAAPSVAGAAPTGPAATAVPVTDAPPSSEPGKRPWV